MYHKLNQPPREESEYDIATDLIDECVSSNQIVEISKGNYALVPRAAMEIFQQT